MWNKHYFCSLKAHSHRAPRNDNENPNIAMEQNNNARELEQSEEILAKAGQYKKAITWCLIVAAVAVIGILAWIMISQNGSRNADELIAKADTEAIAGNDSIATSLYAQAAEAGYKSGNRAKAEMGIRLYREGKYEEALKYLDACSLDDEVANAGVYSLKGDCYANLEQYDKALSCFKKAVSAADENPEAVPFFLIKEANIYRMQGKYADEANAYKQIIDEYPAYVTSTRIDINRFYQRALAQSRQ